MTDRSPSDLLLCAARRYALDRSDQLHRQRRVLIEQEDSEATDWAHGQISSREHTIEAITLDMLRLNPDSLPSWSDLREHLVLSAQTSSILPLNGLKGDRLAASDEERDLFTAFVRMQDESSPAAVDPLPYLHVASKSHAQGVLSELNERWGVEGRLWFPLIAGEAPRGVDIYWSEHLGALLPEGWFRDQLSDSGVSRFISVSENGTVMIEDRSYFDPCYDGLEHMYTSQGFDWLLYCSHESTTTVSGWLAEQVRTEVPNWKSVLFDGWKR